MTRDGEMPTRDYVRLVLNGTGGEKDVGVLQTLHRQALGAVTRFADPAWAPEGLQMIADQALDALRTAAPGADHQLAWLRAVASAARSAEPLTFLRGLLDGTEVVDGLQVDAELRWWLLFSLVAMGAAGDAEIDAEEQRDATASGQQRATGART